MNSEENKESKQKSEDLNNINTITNNKIPLMNNSGKIIMDISNSKSNNLSESIKSWLKQDYNFYFIAILVFAIAIRLYYFILTNGQPLWWDESEYAAFANTIAHGFPYEISAQRVILFPVLISILFKIGFGEMAAKFLLVLIPSMLIILFTYLFVKEMYDKKIAILTAFMSSIFWIHLFYTQRLMNDELSFLFGLVAFFLFWKGYIKGNNKLYIYLSSFLITLSFLLRPAGIYYAAILIIFLLITEQHKFLFKARLWMMVVVFFLTYLPHMIWSYFYHGMFYALQNAANPGQEAFGWNVISLIPIYTEKALFIAFIIGLFTLLPMVLNFDRIIKGSKKYNADLLMVLLILFNLAINIFVLRSFEDRWLMPMSLAIFIFSSKGLISIYEFIKKNFNKNLAVILIIAILLFGAYEHINHGDQIIKLRKDSYFQVKEAGLWIKENSNPGDKVFSASVPQNAYYSQRETFRFNQFTSTEENETQFLNFLNENSIRYYVVSVFEVYPAYMISLPAKYPQVFVPLRVFQSGEQPILIIYEINNKELGTIFQQQSL